MVCGVLKLKMWLEVPIRRVGECPFGRRGRGIDLHTILSDLRAESIFNYSIAYT